jgi:RimJ/RimL family protein N-acetyltransferase
MTDDLSHTVPSRLDPAVVARRLLRRPATRALAALGLRLIRDDALAPRLERALRGRPFPDPEEPLSDGVIRLRPIARRDLPALTAACSEAGVRYMAGWVCPFTEADAQRWLDDQNALREAGMALDFAVADVAQDDFIGLLQLRQIDWKDKKASVGLWLKPEARGMGMMSRGLNLLLDWVFRHELLDRVEYLVRADNNPSLSLAQRCGFQAEGVLHSCIVSERRRHDAVLLAALRADWLETGPSSVSTRLSC